MLEERPHIAFGMRFMVKTLVSLISKMVFLFLFVPFGLFRSFQLVVSCQRFWFYISTCIRKGTAVKLMKAEKYLSSHDLTKTICRIVAMQVSTKQLEHFRSLPGHSCEKGCESL